MKTLLTWALALLLLACAPVCAGQIYPFTTLHSFTALLIHGDNSDGAYPQTGLVLSGNTLYGTAERGGSLSASTGFAAGTVFAVNTDGTGFTTLHNFGGGSSDGASPQAGLILSGNTLYGTTVGGGSISGQGTVFAINTDGTGFTILHSFTAVTNFPANINSDGANPYAGLILSGNTLYGTAANGGSSGHGTVFAVNTDGTGFTNLHSFTALLGSVNSDGAYPYAGLILSGNTLYGTAPSGGSLGYGTVFAVNTDGTGFTILHTFTRGSDGGGPIAGLILSGNTLYGTASGGGSSDHGTVFAINTDGTGFTTLHNFGGGSDGANPYAGLILSGNTLYGTAVGGAGAYQGTVFAIHTDGTGFTNLHSLTAESDGNGPWAGLVLSGNTLYGTARQGGGANAGTVFSLSLGSVIAPPVISALTSSSSLTTTGATLNGTVNANGGNTTVIYVYGLTASYGTTVTAAQSPLTGSTATAVSAALTGLTAGTTYHYRIVATNSGGTTNGTDQAFTTLTSLANWRQTWYGTTANTGNAADAADPYSKGIRNLAVFALLGSNQSPSQASLTQLPQVQGSGGNYIYSFAQPEGVSGVTYGAEWTISLSSPDWQPIGDIGSGTQHIFSVLIGSNAQMFLRLTVSEQ